MPRITKVYTRSGDDGSTTLGVRGRVSKDSLRVAAYGTVDELNAHLGVALAAGLDARVAQALRKIQGELFHLGSDLCIPEEDKERLPVPTIQERHIGDLEALIDELQQDLEPLENFVLPGGSAGAAHLHVARTVCRRAERRLVSLARSERTGSHTLPYLNRLSDALFVMARFENRRCRVTEPVWDSRG